MIVFILYECSKEVNEHPEQSTLWLCHHRKILDEIVKQVIYFWNFALVGLLLWLGIYLAYRLNHNIELKDGTSSFITMLSILVPTYYSKYFVPITLDLFKILLWIIKLIFTYEFIKNRYLRIIMMFLFVGIICFLGEVIKLGFNDFIYWNERHPIEALVILLII